MCFRFGTAFACAVAACAFTVACTGTDDNVYGTGMQISGGMNAGGSVSTDLTSSEELFNFDVTPDDSYLSEASDYDASDEDMIENTSFKKIVSVVFSSAGAECGTLPDGVTASVSGGKVTIDASTSENVLYKLSGSCSDGMFKIYSEKKCAVELSGLTLNNGDGPAINIQTKKRVFIDIAEGTSNTLSDGTSYADTGDEDAKGVIFSEGQLVFSGAGKLDVTANCKAGISSDQYLRFRPGNVIDVTASGGNAVRGKDSVIVSGGVMNISVSGQGNKGIKSDGPVRISGGRTTITDSAAAYYDTDEAETKGPACVNSDGDFTVTGGELWAKATGKGGKGVTADGDMSIGGGKLRIITTGQKFTYSSSSSSGFGGGPGGGFGGTSSSSDNNKSPKGLRAEGTMTITAGDVMSRTTGGSGSEGIEGKSVMEISGGAVQSYAYDDAINSGGVMTLSGGNIFAVSSGNDGIDSNGNMYITGGSVTAMGLGEDGLDVIERGTMSITGGEVFSLGNTYMNSPSSSASTQQYVTTSVTGLSSGTIVKLTDSSSSVLFSYTMPFSVSRAYMLLSLPSLAKGNSYTLTAGSASQSLNL